MLRFAQLSVLLVCMVLVGSCHRQSEGSTEPINAILGDASFVAKFGIAPDDNSDETLRIKTHLEYVERLLRDRDLRTMPEELKKARERLLDLLREYWTASVFPRNYDHASRKPCFIDRDGRVCAVAYLVERTAGRELASTINSAHQYAMIAEMDEPALTEWVANSGLSLEELAAIQPTYWGWGPFGTDDRDYIPVEYGVASASVIGLNAGLNLITGINLLSENPSTLAPALGMFTGTGQIMLAVADLTGSQSSFTRRNSLSFTNIGVGTGTLLLSTYALVNNRYHKKRNNLAWCLLPTISPGYNGVSATFSF